MAAKGTWTVIFDDKIIINQSDFNPMDGQPIGYKINDDAFWNNPSYSNFWAVQYQNSNNSDEVEFKDETPNDTWASTGLDFQPFIDKWNAANLVYQQQEWDGDNVDGETEAEKIARLGPRPTA